MPNKSGSRSGRTKKNYEPEVVSPGKKKPRPHAKDNMPDKGPKKDNGVDQDGKCTSRQKRKKVQVYRVRSTPMLTAETVHPLAFVVRNGVLAPVAEEVQTTDAENNESNKKRRSDNYGSADQAGGVEQPRQTQ
jgi:hypothetical protein